LESIAIIAGASTQRLTMNQSTKIHGVTSSDSRSAAAATLISITILTLKRKSHKNESSLSYPPSPPHPHWIWGHALHLRPDPARPKRSHDLFLEWSKKLNSKIIMFQIPLLDKIIIVNDANIARYVLVGDHSKSPTYKTLLPLIGRKSMVAKEGEVWAKQRKLYIPGLHFHHCGEVQSLRGQVQ
jgi:cytochrome P450